MQSKKTEKTQTKPKPKSRTATRTRPEDPNKTATDAATVHDLVGAALLILPKELRDLLGEPLLQSNAQELESQEVLVIVREEGVVAYVHLPIVVMEMQGKAADLAGTGTTLRPVTGPFTKRLKRQIKAYDMVSMVKPVGKGGRHA